MEKLIYIIFFLTLVITSYFGYQKFNNLKDEYQEMRSSVLFNRTYDPKYFTEVGQSYHRKATISFVVGALIAALLYLYDKYL